MKNQNLQSIGAAIDRFLKQNRLDRKMDVSSLHHNWKEIAGEMIAKHTTKIYLKESTVFLQVDSAALKNELLYLKDQLVQNINTYFNKDLVKEIVLL